MSNVTIGMDLGDKNNVVYVMHDTECLLNEQPVENSEESLRSFFSNYPGATVAIEAGTHSPWVSRLLITMGCKVLVGNPRKLRAIWDSDDKCDGRDAEMLARIAKFDQKLLYPIRHRGEQAQIDLGLVKARDILVKNRTSLINHFRGSIKSTGLRLPTCSAESFHRKVKEALPNKLEEAFLPVLDIIEQITSQIKSYDSVIEKISQERYPETQLLRAVKGVGPLTAIAFVLILEDPDRFKKSRQVGRFLGLVPRRDQSGEVDKQLPITKAGSSLMRKLLVGAAQYILGPFGEDCNLRRFGERLAKGGGKSAKRRAVVAVARKLAVLLHRLWKNGEVYEPLYSAKNSCSVEAVLA